MSIRDVIYNGQQPATTRIPIGVGLLTLVTLGLYFAIWLKLKATALNEHARRTDGAETFRFTWLDVILTFLWLPAGAGAIAIGVEGPAFAVVIGVLGAAAVGELFRYAVALRKLTNATIRDGHVYAPVDPVFLIFAAVIVLPLGAMLYANAVNQILDTKSIA